MRYVAGSGSNAGALADRPVPLRDVVARCLEDWEVTSEDSEESDDFCGWRVGSRAHSDSDAQPGVRQLPPGTIEEPVATSGRPPGRTAERHLSCCVQ